MSDGNKKHPGGRPSKYNPDIHIPLAEAYGECGYTDKEIATRLKITEATLTNWKHEHPEFFASLKKGKEIPDKLVVRALFQRACGYSHPEDKIFYDSKTGETVVEPTIKHYPPDTLACIFYLKNRMPSEWRDRQEITGNMNLTYTITPRKKDADE